MAHSSASGSAKKDRISDAQKRTVAKRGFRWVRPVLMTAWLASFVGAYFAAERHFFPHHGELLKGLQLSGKEIPLQARQDENELRNFIRQEWTLLVQRQLDITSASAKRTIRLEQMIHPLSEEDIERTVRYLKWFGRENMPHERIHSVLKARRGEIDVPLPFTIEEQSLATIMQSIKEEIDTHATDAKLDLANHTIAPDTHGRYFETEGSLALAKETIMASLRKPYSPLKPLTLPFIGTRARVTKESLAKLDISTVVGTFETYFGRGGGESARATNIETAARKLDGLVIEPSQMISFNHVVGERSEANGFKTAWEIYKGEMRPGIGGGTCQVASTLHAAAFFGGLEILERLPHSRPSGYIQMGLDSTVVYPVVDLKLRNPYAFPVVLHTKVNANKLTVEVLGKEKPYEVAFSRDVVDTLPYRRRIDEESWIKTGRAVKKQSGIKGYRIRRSRLLTSKLGKPARTEVSYDFYPPTVEIFQVAPGTDPDELPPLPEDVAEALAKKDGEKPEKKNKASDGEKKENKGSENKSTAVACVGECADSSKPSIEVREAPGVHAPTGDQANPRQSMRIKQ